MTRQEAIKKLEFIEQECRRVREAFEAGSNYYNNEPHGAIEQLCAASCEMDAVYAGPVEDK